MRLYNTATRVVERFRPRAGSPVTVYVCGITPYDTTHLGHAFTYLWHDVLIRHFEIVHSWPVRYVQNVTDIDDDILKRAALLDVRWDELGRSWTERFVRDLRRLNARPPDAYPTATETIEAIVREAATLIDRGCAYTSGGGVYLDSRLFERLGAGLADEGPDGLLALANERGNVPGDPNKRHPLDPVLWQPAREGEPAWKSPWGAGRPGWHIECAAMARVHLGEVVDVHGGGDDLRFPHHAFEAHTAECLSGHPFVRFWTHIAMVEKDGAKMAKSVGNLVMVADLLESNHPDTLRLYLASHHYRRAWSWDAAEFERTDAWRRTLHGAARRSATSGRAMDPAPFGPRFTAALDDDMNTPEAVRTCLDLADAILEAPSGVDIRPAQDILATLCRVLGLTLREYDAGEPAGAPWPAVVAARPDWEAWPAVTL